jgi:hypothetical protein
MSGFKIHFTDICTVCSSHVSVYDMCQCQLCKQSFCIYCMQDWIDNDFAKEEKIGRITIYTCCFCVES